MMVNEDFVNSDIIQN